MDISALLGGGEKMSSLNDDLAARDASGKSVFSNVFGASTAWHVASGEEGGKDPQSAVRVSFIFDPHEMYSESAVLASMNPDYLAELREELTRYLLTKDEIADRVPTVEELRWRVLKKNLPQRSFEKFFDKEALQEYVDMLSEQVKKNYREEKLMWERIRTGNFSFEKKIAVDAYLKKQARGVHERKGVLTFRVEAGKPAIAALGLVHELDLRASASDHKLLTVPDAGEDISKSDPSTPKDKKKKRGSRARTPSQVRRDDMVELATLMDELKLVPHEDMVTKKIKEFPETTGEWFDQVQSWFNTVVSTQAQLVEDRQSGRVSLYQ